MKLKGDSNFTTNQIAQTGDAVSDSQNTSNQKNSAKLELQPHDYLLHESEFTK